MKKYYILALITCLATIAHAQIKYYKGNATGYSDCLYTIANGKIYKGNSTSYSDCLLTVEGKKVYQGNSTGYADCLVTVDGIVKYALVAILIGPF
jgi:hypothetical protein